MRAWHLSDVDDLIAVEHGQVGGLPRLEDQLSQDGRSQVPSMRLEVSPSRISRKPSAYRREASCGRSPG